MTAKWQYKEAYEAALVTARELRAENAKLRELCADIHICARDNECSLCYLTSEKCDFSDRMRELGIEVEQ